MGYGVTEKQQPMPVIPPNNNSTNNGNVGFTTSVFPLVNHLEGREQGTLGIAAFGNSGHNWKEVWWIQEQEQGCLAQSLKRSRKARLCKVKILLKKPSGKCHFQDKFSSLMTFGTASFTSYVWNRFFFCVCMIEQQRIHLALLWGHLS